MEINGNKKQQINRDYNKKPINISFLFFKKSWCCKT